MLRKRREAPAALVERLYDAHGAALYRYALMLVGDHSAAEDVVQQVFTALLRQPRTIDNELHYLRRSVRNGCYSMLRQPRGAPIDDRPLLETIEPARIAVDDRIALERALLSLPAEQREVVHLHVFEGMTFQETADTMNESVNTVASRYRYAIEKLRAAFRGAPERS
ncbi:MAG TPA: sigma-70 family RNA polymerase sigma factor [Vicinamibacterales bacterium]